MTQKSNTMFWVVGSICLTVMAFLIVPPLLKKYTNKAYKKSLKKEDIDFDAMGPEIVPSKKEEE